LGVAAVEATDCGDLAVLDAEIRFVTRHTGPIDDGAILNDRIKLSQDMSSSSVQRVDNGELNAHSSSSSKHDINSESMSTEERFIQYGQADEGCGSGESYERTKS